MKQFLPAFLSTVALSALLGAAPAVAQDTVTGAPAGTAPTTVQGYGYAPGQPRYGYNGYGPAYGYGSAPGYGHGYGTAPGYAAPWGPVGAVAAGFGPVGAGVANAAGAVGAGAKPAPAYAVRPNRCDTWHDWNGRYTAFCGP
jgi:hypothetical protein